ncbi:MAG: DUF1772 domain-containing protein [Leifsonia xyli]|nr:MAG: DUF1772 domain-containing protein [Leifsonia xyli]
MLLTWLQFAGVFLAGILAGEELIVRWGVQPALHRLDDRSHVHARMALVRRLMVAVPVIMIPTVIVAILVVVFAGTGPGLAFRIAGIASLAVFLGCSFLGTVPINITINETWNPDAPPTDWREVVRRWEVLDTFRSSAATLAFACFLAAVALESSA